MASKPIKGYEGLYEIDTEGNVFSTNRRVKTKNGKILSLKGRMIKQFISTSGYKNVGLHKEGKQEMRYVHRLVAQTFIENPRNYPQINHKNENRLDNRVDNLEWCTAKYNSNYGGHGQRISAAAQTKRTIISYTKDGIIKEYKTMKAAAEDMAVSLQAVWSAIKKGEPFTCCNLYWKYINN
jgi:hypothetical protein